jgi:hypothetical protein
MQNNSVSRGLQQIAPSFEFEPFGQLLRPSIEAALRETGQDKVRKGTILLPLFLVSIVLGLTLRRDLNTEAVIQWLVSTRRWMELKLETHLLSDGALSHARVRLGFEVFRRIFDKFAATQKLTPDFHGLTTLLFDGSTLNMPDTEKNQAEFPKHTTQHGAAGFPQLRVMALLVGATHFVLDLAFAACRGKGTGEHSLMREILQRLPWRQWLLLVDIGLYSFALLWTVQQRHEYFLLKVKQDLRFTPIRGSAYGDGSYLAVLTGKIDGRRQSLTVRVIDCQLRGFRPFRLMTNLLDPKITARELVRHYHQRWEIEIAFDEIKTHQAATLRGQSPTILRSRRADLVKQELYALFISYNGLRALMQQAAEQSGKAPRELSFLQTLQAVIDATPYMNWRAHPRSLKRQRRYLLGVIAESEIEFARRPRINPRVVKVNGSKFARKTAAHQGEKRDFEKDLFILATHGKGQKLRPRVQAA